MTNTDGENQSASEQIDAIIKLHGGWKADLLAALRHSIMGASTGLVEEVKWKMATRPEGLPVWSQQGIICFAEIWKDNVKLLFPKGAQLTDPKAVFNARLQSKDIRAIEFKEGSNVDSDAIQALVVQAVELNTAK